MVGTWRWNVTLGICGAVLTLLFSLGSNGLAVTSIRCLYALIAFYALAYLFRALIAVILRPGGAAPEQSPETAEEAKGGTVDLSTPDESEQLNDMLKMQMDGSGKPEQGEQPIFQPMTPPKLVSMQNNAPEEMAKAIRHLTGG